ncbi:hypothetical protein E4U42_006992 [Claviceps africana]|uniref:Zn(2)-C6 fungal-type domain-containing protein n=1 Tax=Claviceps africana TaxID=83212 RepID=A0A8K0J2B9_9HYPO|nr:hypothetical protein E4U42_006992 [Claviceps africana]
MEIQFFVSLDSANRSNSSDLSTKNLAGLPSPRKRHVKCDETRPACLNCLKWRGYCEAYADAAPDQSSNSSPPTSRTAGAHRDAHAHAQLIHTKKARLLIAEPDVNSVRFSSSEQRAYFDEWIGLSIAFLGGGFNQTRLWAVTMPQVTMEETTLRYGAMAVGALRKAYEAGDPSTALGTDNRHYLNGVMYYCKALRLQSKAKPTRGELRTALLSSLLFICFEAQRGNMPAALKHISHGFSMLNELAVCTDLAPGLVSIAQAPPALVREILACYKPLELQSRSFLGSYKAFLHPPMPDRSNQGMPPGPSTQAAAAQVSASPSSQPITPRQSPTRTVEAAAATGSLRDTGLLSPQSLSSDLATPPPQSLPLPPTAPHRFTSIAPFTKHSPYFRPCQADITTLDVLPPTLRSLEEAEGYWVLVQKLMVSHLPMLTMVTSQLGLSRVSDEAELERKLSSVKRNPAIDKLMAETRHWLFRWADAFEPVYESACRDAVANPQAYLRAVNLRIEYLILDIYTTIPRFSDLATAKRLTPQYRQVNRLAETLLRSLPNCGFSMDSGWTWPLFISSFSCRDPHVRRDAIRILEQYPIRNVLRDSHVFRAIALRNEEVEGQVLGGAGGEHEQWLQLRRRELVFADLGTSIIFRSAQRHARTGRWELVEEIAGVAVLPDGRLDWRRQPISENASILSGVC